MSYYIYGLRLCGDIECRYVGMTKHQPNSRLANLTQTAKLYVEDDRAAPDGLWRWLLDNRGKVEAFKVGKVETAIEARAMEKAIIALVLQLGHRLLNCQHVPVAQRIGYVPTGWSKHRYENRLRRQTAKAA